MASTAADAAPRREAFDDRAHTGLWAARIGPWWMFTEQTDGLGGCPFGYTFHGGG